MPRPRAIQLRDALAFQVGDDMTLAVVADDAEQRVGQDNDGELSTQEKGVGHNLPFGADRRRLPKRRAGGRFSLKRSAAPARAALTSSVTSGSRLIHRHLVEPRIVFRSAWIGARKQAHIQAEVLRAIGKIEGR
jgi:hypothetical protein